MERTLLSVIIPVYNTEKYFDKCIKSVIAQSYQELEIILVDDGSTDSSGEMCDFYAKHDLRVKVFHQDNKGQNAARKLGIDYAKGDYITFVDSDDWLESELYEQIFSSIGEDMYDMVVYDNYVDKNDTYQIVRSSIEVGAYDRESILSKIVSRMRWDFTEGKTGISSALWNKFFKKSLLQETMKNMDYAMTICEDSAIVYPYILRTWKLLVTDCCGYHYFQREGSAMHSFSVDTFEKMSRFQMYMKAELAHLEEMYGDITMPLIEQVEEQFDQVLARVLNTIVRDVYHINMMLKWCPPYECLPKDGRIVIYGAGDVGQSYQYKLYGEPCYRIVAWVDQNASSMRGVEKPEYLKEIDYDIVLIAIESEAVANQIRSKLLALGIEKDKVVWEKPRPIPFRKWVK